MLIQVGQFCDRVESDLAGLVDELQAITERYGDQERQAWMRSLPKLSVVLARPQLQSLHLHLGQSAGLALEYRLPASSSWCDAVLLGRTDTRPSAVIVELKDWDTGGDRPGPREGLVQHKGACYLHPAEQVRGYVEYCQRFHSAVQAENADVHGCVLFTRATDTTAYTRDPHARLTAAFPVFTNAAETVDHDLMPFLTGCLKYPDPDFALRFENGVYIQDRNFVLQVSKAIRQPSQKQFVLLDEQRRGYEECMRAVDRLIAETSSTEKLVVIIEGPPGSGKSVIAAHLWATLVSDFQIDGPIVVTTTSGCQRSNWEELFAKTYATAARGVVVPANRYNPGLTTKWVKDRRAEGHPLVVSDWKNNVALFLRSGHNRCLDNSFAVSIVDEAHALIDPTAPGAEGVPPSGWVMHAGPQAWHIIRSSRVSVFLMDSEQSYRDNETTTRATIERFATEQGVARVERVTLAGAQFRCGGSKEYMDWLECLLAATDGTRPANLGWRRGAQNPSGPFTFEIVDHPQAMEDALRGHMREGKTACLVSNYAREWVTKDDAAPHDLPPDRMDFHIPYTSEGQSRWWSRIWNYAPEQNYSLFIQRPQGTRMHVDPLCEVGCPYVVRGFDFDYLGVLWLSDLVWRGDGWRYQLNRIYESAWPRTKAAAKPGRDGTPRPEAIAALLQRLKRGYRILLTRAIHGVYLWIEDDETRCHVLDLLREA